MISTPQSPGTLVQASAEEIRALAADMVGLPGAPAWTEAHWLAYGAPQADQRSGVGIWLFRCDGRKQAGAWLAGSWVHGIAELEYLFVFPAQRRRRLGLHSLRSWLAWLGAQAVQEVLLEVRVGNAAGRALYAAVGFHDQGRRARYYSSPVEDAILMRCFLSPHARP